MNRRYAWIVGGVAACWVMACASTKPQGRPHESSPEPRMNLSSQMASAKDELVKKHGSEHAPRIERGLAQVAAMWREDDGDYAAFVREQFIADPKLLDATFQRLQESFEQLEGYENEIAMEWRKPTDVDLGPLLPIDPLLATYNPSAHTTEDLFKTKIGFIVLLNFPLANLQEKLDHGPQWSRRQWAEARLAGRFARRVPAEIQQAISEVSARTDLYIAEYNIWMHHVLGEGGARLFPKGKRLISHWNLRDELKAQYSAGPEGQKRQQLILQIMERIVTQTIPASVINNPRVDWDPVKNTVTASPEGELEEDAPPNAAAPSTSPEPDTRYKMLWAQFEANRRADPYSPTAPTAIARSFELGREMPEERVKGMMLEVLGSPLVKQVAAEIERRVGRKLEPQDLWFDGFQSRSKIPEAKLDAAVRGRYPNREAFVKDLPTILQKLGFSAARAQYLSTRIVVDPSRGAGHAMPSFRRGSFPRLRTRIEKEGMNYKGYNIAVHELGHNVEQVFSLYDVDHTLLQGVPNNAFTEALAFVFQHRDLELLGLSKPDAESEKARVLNDFWATWEIAGVSLVDVAVWHWMYDHPSAPPSELREAVVRISREVWNQHYAPILGGKDSVLLGIYSHMIAYPLYLIDYPMGHLISFQIEEQVTKAKGKLGDEFERMAKFGSVSPDLWMQNASGAPVGPGPLLRATAAVLGPAK
jgi:hypothetical protein